VILVDTGFWLALANAADRNHSRARKALATHRRPFITTWPVMTETCHMLASRLGMQAQLAFVHSAAIGAFEVFPLGRFPWTSRTPRS
jgi:predicted nucleic acid-binding protein